MKTVCFYAARAMLALTTATMLAACVSTPPSHPRLEAARAAYEGAAADTLVARSASVELQQAQQALQKADSALRAGDDAAEIDHYVYLARQRTEVAVQAGIIAQAEHNVARAQAQRDRILIDARTGEADSQRASAEQALIAAKKARDEAEVARKLAEEQLAAAAAAKARAGTLEAELAEMKEARKTDRGMVLTLGDVLFDTAKATLNAGAMRTLDKLAEFLTNNAARKVLIEGHTDSVGSDEFNRELSYRRAEAVRRALRDRYIADDRIVVSGMGEDYPVASNDTAAGRQQNRRVEVIFSDNSGAFKARATN